MISIDDAVDMKKGKGVFLEGFKNVHLRRFYFEHFDYTYIVKYVHIFAYYSAARQLHWPLAFSHYITPLLFHCVCSFYIWLDIHAIEGLKD